MVSGRYLVRFSDFTIRWRTQYPNLSNRNILSSFLFPSVGRSEGIVITEIHVGLTVVNNNQVVTFTNVRLAKGGSPGHLIEGKDANNQDLVMTIPNIHAGSSRMIVGYEDAGNNRLGYVIGETFTDDALLVPPTTEYHQIPFVLILQQGGVNLTFNHVADLTLDSATVLTDLVESFTFPLLTNPGSNTFRLASEKNVDDKITALLSDPRFTAKIAELAPAGGNDPVKKYYTYGSTGDDVGNPGNQQVTNLGDTRIINTLGGAFYDSTGTSQPLYKPLESVFIPKHTGFKESGGHDYYYKSCQCVLYLPERLDTTFTINSYSTKYVTYPSDRTFISDPTSFAAIRTDSLRIQNNTTNGMLAFVDMFRNNSTTGADDRFFYAGSDNSWSQINRISGITVSDSRGTGGTSPHYNQPLLNNNTGSSGVATFEAKLNSSNFSGGRSNRFVGFLGIAIETEKRAI